MTIDCNGIGWQWPNFDVTLSGRCQGQGQGGGKKLVQKGGNVLTLRNKKANN